MQNMRNRALSQGFTDRCEAMFKRLLLLTGFKSAGTTAQIEPRRATAADLAQRVIVHPNADRLRPETIERFEYVAAGGLQSRTDVTAALRFLEQLGDP